jgi:hypothetical protein
MPLRNPERYRQVVTQRQATAGLRQLAAASNKALREAREAKRKACLAKHPRKKQPRHVRECQPLQPLNPHQPR